MPLENLKRQPDPAVEAARLRIHLDMITRALVRHHQGYSNLEIDAIDHYGPGYVVRYRLKTTCARWRVAFVHVDGVMIWSQPAGYSS